MFKERSLFFLILVLVILLGFQGMPLNERGINKMYKDDQSQQQLANQDYYTEKYRPQYHFSTPNGRLADPNGLVYFDDEYHLFHQKMGKWAHAVSKDMIHWEHLPIALDHDELGQALSGSAVVDANDSSGLFDGQAGLVAIYTSTEGGEAQSIAYSKDKGRTWERYEGNPVIENPGIKDFRDPKVFWHSESEKWVMAVSTDQSVTFYNSDNLIEWEYQSRFGDDEGSHVAVWETPDLFQLPVDGDEENNKWVLHVGVGDNNITDGSTSQYFIGEFDGKSFANDNPPETVLTTDYGQDFYAAQSFNNIPEEDGRRIWMGWMVNWRYPYQSPTEPWMGSMSIPRELSLRTTKNGEVRLFQNPVHEIEKIRATNFSIDSLLVEGNHKIEDFSGTTYEFEAFVEWDEVEEFGIRLKQSENEETVVGFNTKAETVFLDRTNAGLDTLIDRNGNPFNFGKRFQEKLSTENKQLKIHGFVDESSIEIFINDGEYVFTNLIYTNPTNKNIELYTKGGSVEVASLNFYHLNSIWRDTPGEGEVDRIMVSDEEIILEVGEEKEVIAHIKPDWLFLSEPMVWQSSESDIIEVNPIDQSKVTITGTELGSTSLIVKDPNEVVSKEITVKVVEDKDSDYFHGWGPSPLSGILSGKWDIIDEFSIGSYIENSPEWREIYKEEVFSGDFSVSADIEWLGQGEEGFPKYGIVITDEMDTMVSGFFNADINQIETFARNRYGDLGWEGVDLPSGTNLQDAQTLKIEKTGDAFNFYLNGEKVYERTVPMTGDIGVGIINENTAANFTNFKVERVVDYTEGWGPSPITGSISGIWDIIDESSVISMLGNGDDWTEIFREQTVTNDFSVSTDIKWLNQGIEGFPKYGIVLHDPEDTVVSAFLNSDINELETFVKYQGDDVGWEGAKLPQNIDLKEFQTLQIKRIGDSFLFYLNDQLMHTREVSMSNKIATGIVNINTNAEFKSYNVEAVVDEESSNDDGDKLDDTDIDKGSNDNRHKENEDTNNDINNKSKHTGDGSNNQQEDQHINTDENKDHNDQGKELPKTATNNYNLILFGLLFILVSSTLILIARRKRKAE